VPGIAVAALALAPAWLPWESFPWTAPLVAAVALLALPWGWARWRPPAVAAPAAALAAVWATAVLAVAGDREAALGQLGLLAAAAAAGWLSARRQQRRIVSAVAAGVALLATWGIYQVAWGFAAAERGLGALPAPLREAAAYRLATRRPFAGLALPGHLAVLLATALPVLLDRIARGRRRAAWGALLALDLVALGLTRSLLGALLASGVLLATAPSRWRRPAAAAAVLAVAAAAAVRPDLVRLEPFLQRLDNWRTAAWVWWHHPFLGVGPGGLRQASQRVPFAVRSVSAYAHDLPLQALAELGLPGLLVLLLAGRALVRLLRRGWAVDRPLALAVAVVALHNLLDFSLYVSGVALPWAVLLGQLHAEVRARDPAPAPARGRAAAVAACALALAMAALGATSRTLEEAAAAAREPAAAVRAHRLAPWRAGPALLAASLVGKGDGASRLARAVRERLRVARWARPGSATLELAEARVDLLLADPVSALAAAERARELRPGWRPAEAMATALRRRLEGR